MKLLRAEHLAACAHARDFPRHTLAEIAFLGRSNVGKSSLLNRLVQRKSLARTSSTPGKTRLVHFFHVETSSDELAFVDLPGYGWARVSRGERGEWQALVESYLEGRDTLKLAILLQDLRRDISDDETLLLEWLSERNVPTLVALTKVDKLKPMRRAQRIRELRGQLTVPVVATSSQKGEGISELWREIRQHL